MSFLQRILARLSPSSATAPAPSAPLAGAWLIVGLGNPGEKYATTRHNIGFMAVDTLVGSESFRPDPEANALVAVAEVAGQQVVLAQPQTFMNDSGVAVAPLAQRLDIAPDHIIIIHDELDLPQGTVRVKSGGKDNGHNGLRSITTELGTVDYLRVRMGISRPPRGTTVIDYVLGNVTEPVDDSVELANQAVHLLVSEGLGRAQQAMNRRQ